MPLFWVSLLSVIILNNDILSVVMIGVIIMNADILSVAILSVVILNVVASRFELVSGFLQAEAWNNQLLVIPVACATKLITL